MYLQSMLAWLSFTLACTSFVSGIGTNEGRIDRYAIVSRYNPTRNASSTVTPLQVGNGNFAFGVDVTGLQTFQPFAIMSTFGWKNDSFPPGRSLEDIQVYKGTSLDNHGRNVTYMYNGAPDIMQWLISNPNRVNLGRVGLLFLSPTSEVLNVTESDLENKTQKLDLWTGEITSSFSFNGSSVTVRTVSAQDASVVGVQVDSPLLKEGKLGLFLDFPWNDGSDYFSAPFVGFYNATSNHTTNLVLDSLPRGAQAEIAHTLENNTFITTVGGAKFNISRDSPDAHRYSIVPSQKSSSAFSISISYGLESPGFIPSFNNVKQSSVWAWRSFWTDSGFVDLVTGSTDPRADELQRRIILSSYLMRVNEASDYPPQESGLVNNGWYGKFHMEMVYWHSAHWALWGRWDLLHRTLPVYFRFFQTSIDRARIQQGFPKGARWGKMSDPSGRSSPGVINELLIWQQPHPIVFAEYEYRAFPYRSTLTKWRDVIKETADWMSVFAYHNESTGKYDIGPPMYLVNEDTDPLVTRNPAFELSYWKFGLQLAENWFKHLGEAVPEDWTNVRENLASLPVDNGTYSLYEGIRTSFWNDPEHTNDHPSLVGLYGWLPETAGLNLTIAKATMEKTWTHWNISNCWGWDFGMLAMSAARNGEPEQAISWLLHDHFSFDDVGMPTSGKRVPTPYFPGSGSLLLAIAFLAEGWDGSSGTTPGFPKTGWNVRAEGLAKAL